MSVVVAVSGVGITPVTNAVVFFVRGLRGFAGCALGFANGFTNFSQSQKLTPSEECAQDVLVQR